MKTWKNNASCIDLLPFALGTALLLVLSSGVFNPANASTLDDAISCSRSTTPAGHTAKEIEKSLITNTRACFKALKQAESKRARSIKRIAKLKEQLSKLGVKVN